VNGEIADAIVGWTSSTRQAIDKALIALDGSESKTRLGAKRAARRQPGRRARRGRLFQRAASTAIWAG